MTYAEPSGSAATCKKVRRPDHTATAPPKNQAEIDLEQMEDERRQEEAMQRATSGQPKESPPEMTEREAVKESLSLLAVWPPERHIDLRGCNCATCKPELYTRFHQDSAKQIYQRGLHCESHDAWNLAALAVASFTSEKLPYFGQLKAMDDWKRWWAGGRSDTAKQLRYSLDHRKDIRATTFFRKPVEMFNQMFFLGSLPPKEIAVCWGLDKRMVYGIATARPIREGVSTIVLNPENPHHKFNPDAVLCTILHEMTHVFLSRYSCRTAAPLGPTKCITTPVRQTKCNLRSPECTSDICAHLRSENLGSTGHGRAWQYLAKSIEENIQRLLGLRGRLGREEGASLELMDVQQGFQPTTCDMEQLYSKFAVYVRLFMRRWYDDLDMHEKELHTKIGRHQEVPKKRRRSIAACQKISPFA